MDILKWSGTEPQNHIFIIKAVSVSAWGSEVVIEGADGISANADDFPEKNVYSIQFKGCKNITWDMLEPDEENLQDDIADPKGFDLGEENYKKPAILYCGFFELSILYKTREVLHLTTSDIIDNK
jgi:hypothetical protein